ncbi:MAG: LysR family transcriptional regulator [Ponticaulis sp.]|nr:LysR family transcriptional regulator [Ponticaulis sp.]
MSKLIRNRSGEMEVFVHVVEMGGFSSAAAQLGMTQPAVSKLITRLETRIDTRLLVRSTRQVSLTAEGCLFYERAKTILTEIDEAERITRSGETPSGHIRLNTSAAFAHHILEPALPSFLVAFPEIEIEIGLTDGVIDILAERTDLVVRAGPLKDSGLVARSLGASRMMLVASPSYLAQNGTPQSISDLSNHFRVGFAYPREVRGWQFNESGRTVEVSLRTRVRANDGDAMRRMAVNGLGIARLTEFSVRNDIQNGLLKPIMEEDMIEDHEAFHVVTSPGTGPMPARTRALMDFMVSNCRVDL